VLNSWRDPSFDYFKVLTVDSKTFLLRCEFETQESELCSEYDGVKLMSRPSIELIAVDAETIHKAERLMESCEQCHLDDAAIPFDWLLAEVTGKHGKYDFALTALAAIRIVFSPFLSLLTIKKERSKSPSGASVPSII
jgi:hypothetical protein